MEVVKLFIVDDHDIFRQGIKSIFSHSDNFKVIGEACDGAEAFAMIQEQSPDIVLLDIEMPKVDGVALIKNLRNANCKSQFIMVSQACQEQRIKELIAVGISGHVLKTDPFEEIYRAIEKVAASQTYFSSAVANRFYEILINQKNHFSASAPPPQAEEISLKELEVAKLVSFGLTNKEIAQRLKRSENTIKTHKSNIMKKLGLKNSAQIGVWYSKLDHQI